MCGIGGIWHPDGRPASHDALRRMMGAMPHRGPEGSGFAALDDGALQLGFLSLAFTEDPAVGMQPLVDPERDLGLLFNGEIYDHDALRRDLAARGHRFATRSDTEVLLRLYTEHGLDLFPFLNGEFAFAVYDGRRRELLAVRDRMGIKPLFYARHGGAFLFASEIGALLAVPGMPRALDPTFFAGTGLGVPDLAQTPFVGVRQVRPGHVLRVRSDGTVDERPYWSPPRHDRPAWRYDDALEALDVTLTRAVERRVGGEVDVALSLSSGVDSATVAALSRRTGRRLPAFGIAFPGQPYDESARAARTAAHLGLDFHPVVCTPASLADGFLPTLRATAWPQPMLSSVSRRALMQAIRGAGHKAVASGEGSDELFGGYPYFRMERIWRDLAAGGARARQAKRDRRAFRRQEALSKGLHWTEGATTPPPGSPLPYASTHVQGALRRQGWLRHILSDDALDAVGDATLLGTLARELEPLGDRHDLEPFDGARWLARAAFAGMIVPILGDRIEMSASLEGRSPFTDLEVVELAWSFPEAFALHPTELVQKRILRDLAAPLLPPTFDPPPKHNHLSPTVRDLAGTPQGAELVHALLDPAHVREAGVLRPRTVAAVRALWSTLPRATPRFRSLDAVLGFVLGWQGLHRVHVAEPAVVEPLAFDIDKTPRPTEVA